MHKKISIIYIITLISFFSVSSISAVTLSEGLSKTLENMTPDDSVDIIISLKTKANIQSIIKEKNPKFRRERLIRALRKNAKTTQARLSNLSTKVGVKNLKSIWLTNSIAATVPVSLLPYLLEIDEIDIIKLDAKVQGPKNRVRTDPSLRIQSDSSDATTLATPGWNGTSIRANELWGLGFSGEGVTVAIMDTGVDADHPDLQSAYRGGTNSWFDPNGEHSTPKDVNGHGTQVAGLIVGADTSGETIGVAPGAQWIAVKIFNDSGNSSLSAIHSGFQWLLDPDGNPSTDDAPHIVNNSWNLQNTVNSCNVEFQADLDILKIADIAIVFSAGNAGANASTSISPANNPESLAVGSIDEAFNIANTSSRGSSACDQSLYPHVAAPGVNVLSTDLTFGGLFLDSYIQVSGTSFAAPHLSGAMALLKSTNANVTTDDIKSAIFTSTLDLGASGSDNDYGWGLLDVAAAYNALTGTGGGTVTAADAPVANADSLTVNEDSNASVNVTANDTADTSVNASNTINPASLVIVSQPADGSVSSDESGNISYTPNANFNGADQFTYTVQDSEGIESNSATVSVTVNAVNDPPVATSESYETPEGTVLNIAEPGVLNNDSDIDGDTLTATGLETPNTVGTVTLNSNGSFTYTPNADAMAGSTDVFNYSVTDGSLTNKASVTIKIIAATPPANNLSPKAENDKIIYRRRANNYGPMTVNISTLLANDSDPDDSTFPSGATIELIGGTRRNGSRIVNNGNGTLTYTPPIYGNTADKFKYQVIDALGGISNKATVTVRIRR